MAWSEITDEQVDANSPINENLTKEGIKNNDDDHETRVLALEATATNWTSQLGTLISATDMGTFTGSLLTDNSNVKALLQQIETALEAATYGVNNFKYQTTTVKETSSVYSNVFTSAIRDVYAPTGLVYATLRFEALRDATLDVLDLRMYINGQLWQCFADEDLGSSGWVSKSASNYFTSGLNSGANTVTLEFRVDGALEDGMSIRNMDMKLYGG